jgi:YD repeat-containing protein
LQHTITEADARGNTTRVREDRLIECSGPFRSTCSDQSEDTESFIISEHEYDLADRLTRVTIRGLIPGTATEETQSRSFDYDRRGFLYSESHPEHAGLSTTYSSFTASGQPRTTVMPGGETLETTFDAAGRPLRTRLSLDNETTWWAYSESVYGTDPTLHEVGKLIASTQYNMLEPPSAWTHAPGEDHESDAVLVRHDYRYDGTAQGMLGRRETLIDALSAATDQSIVNAGFERDRLTGLGLTHSTGSRHLLSLGQPSGRESRGRSPVSRR